MNFLENKNQKLANPFKTMGMLLFFAVFLTACSDDKEIPVPINPEEVITTMNVVLVPEGGGETVTLSYRDLDGNGPNEAVIEGGVLNANTSYSVSIVLLNETVDPPENITIEVEEEGLEHQFFFSSTAGLSFSYGDQDSEGNPIGIVFELQTNAEGNGTLTIVLRHEPNKNAEGVSSGDITNAGGETDISVTFGITVQ